MPHYDTDIEPPAPCVTIQVINPGTGATESLAARKDTGAAMSVIPQRTIAALALEPTGDIWASGYDRRLTQLPTYSVTLGVAGCVIQDVEVTVSSREDILLGRDVLNGFVITLNGKDLTFEIRDP